MSSSKVLRSFKALDLMKKSMVDYQIKFIEPRNFEQAIYQMKTFFLPCERMNRTRNLIHDPVAVEDVLKLWRKILEKEKISIGCFQGETMIGANLLSVKKKCDEKNVEVRKICRG